METKHNCVCSTKKSLDDSSDILAHLRTPEARARLAEDEARIHKSLIERARIHDRYLAESRQLGYHHVTP
jgi:hypothetical protein